MKGELGSAEVHTLDQLQHVSKRAWAHAATHKHHLLGRTATGKDNYPCAFSSLLRGFNELLCL
jgi:hypothetical protein